MVELSNILMTTTMHCAQTQTSVAFEEDVTRERNTDTGCVYSLIISGHCFRQYPHSKKQWANNFLRILAKLLIGSTTAAETIQLVISDIENNNDLTDGNIR